MFAIDHIPSPSLSINNYPLNENYNDTINGCSFLPLYEDPYVYDVDYDSYDTCKNLLNFPLEVIFNIIGYVSFEDITNLYKTCRYFYDIINTINAYDYTLDWGKKVIEKSKRFNLLNETKAYEYYLERPHIINKPYAYDENTNVNDSSNSNFGELIFPKDVLFCQSTGFDTSWNEIIGDLTIGLSDSNIISLHTATGKSKINQEQDNKFQQVVKWNIRNVNPRLSINDEFVAAFYHYPIEHIGSIQSIQNLTHSLSNEFGNNDNANDLVDEWCFEPISTHNLNDKSLPKEPGFIQIDNDNIYITSSKRDKIYCYETKSKENNHKFNIKSTRNLHMNMNLNQLNLSSTCLKWESKICYNKSQMQIKSFHFNNNHLFILSYNSFQGKYWCTILSKRFGKKIGYIPCPFLTGSRNVSIIVTSFHLFFITEKQIWLTNIMNDPLNMNSMKPSYIICNYLYLSTGISMDMWYNGKMGFIYPFQSNLIADFKQENFYSYFIPLRWKMTKDERYISFVMKNDRGSNLLVIDNKFGEIKCYCNEYRPSDMNDDVGLWCIDDNMKAFGMTKGYIDRLQYSITNL